MQPSNTVKRAQSKLLSSRINDFLKAGGKIDHCEQSDNTNNDDLFHSKNKTGHFARKKDSRGRFV